MIVTDLKTLKNKSVKYILDHSLEAIFSELEEELEASEIEGAGLSAIQIGLPLRIAIIRINELSLNLYNAKIIAGSEMITFEGEGCLSLPDEYVDTRRLNKITVKNGDGKVFKLEGIEAIVVQHELDHWDGILMIDRGI